MSTLNANERLLRYLQATPEQHEAIEGILSGRSSAPRKLATGPLLLGMGAGAKLLGVSRATLWRMIRAGKLARVEVLPDSFRVRRADIEAIADSPNVQNSLSASSPVRGAEQTITAGTNRT